jgi:hypothetical protein
VSKDYEQKMREKMQDAADELLSQLAAGEISAEDAQREVDISKALIELIRIAIKMGTWPCPPGQRMQREAVLIGLWPAACRRAGVSVMPMPDHAMRAITSFVGRAS